MTHPRASGEAGFALAEALIALAIVAAVLGALLTSVQGNVGAVARLGVERRAILTAQSTLARVGADIPLASGSIAGETDGLAWTVAVAPYRGDGVGLEGSRLMEVAVTVADPADRRRRVELHSLRVRT